MCQFVVLKGWLASSLRCAARGRASPCASSASNTRSGLCNTEVLERLSPALPVVQKRRRVDPPLWSRCRSDEPTGRDSGTEETSVRDLSWGRRAGQKGVIQCAPEYAVKKILVKGCVRGPRVDPCLCCGPSDGMLPWAELGFQGRDGRCVDCWLACFGLPGSSVEILTVGATTSGKPFSPCWRGPPWKGGVLVACPGQRLKEGLGDCRVRGPHLGKSLGSVRGGSQVDHVAEDIKGWFGPFEGHRLDTVLRVWAGVATKSWCAHRREPKRVQARSRSRPCRSCGPRGFRRETGPYFVSSQEVQA